jgi:lauroyl/myristoyl acyltransferase
MSSLGLRIGRDSLRIAESALGPALLARAMWPAAAAWAGIRVYRRKSELSRDPIAARAAGAHRGAVAAETAAVLTGLAWVFRDRFGRARWLGRFALIGGAPIEEALAAGRPVVVATAHTEAMRLLVRILCARGVDAAMLVEDPARHSARFGRAGDDRFPSRLIGIGDLRAATEFLRGPRALVVPIDPARGRVVEVEHTSRGVTGRFATGAARLARRSGAMCISAVVLGTGPFRYEVRFGAPVEAADQERATASLGRDILRAVIERPECWSGVLRGALRPRGGRPAREGAAHRSGGAACPSAA